MRARSFRLLLAFALTAGVALVPQTVRTQITPLAIDEGATGLGLALRQLPVEGSVLYVTAHPDDENNGVLVALNRGRGLKTSLLTVTRGDGGQNEIGPELFQAIGILRGEELAGVHKYDGADQYHTRAYEFGYSFSVEETFEKWGKDEILRDVVRVIRTRAAGRHPHDEPRRRRRRAASHGVGAARARGVPRRRPIRRGSRNRSRKDCGRGRRARSIRPAAGSAAARRSRRPAPAAPRRRCAIRPATSTRCSACRGRSSDRSRARITSARAWRSSRRFPAKRRRLLALRQRAGDHRRARTTSSTAWTRRSGGWRSLRLARRRRVPSLAADLAAIEAAAQDALDRFDARAPHKTLPALAQRPGARAPAARRRRREHAVGRARKPRSSGGSIARRATS